MNDRELARWIAGYGVELIRSSYGASSCVASTRVALDMFEAFGVDADAVSVDAAAMNAVYWRGLQNGTIDPENRASWPDDAWSVGIGFRKPGDETGHLIAVTETCILDLTLDQASRPSKAIHLTPIALDVDPEPMALFRAGEPVHFARSDGVALTYRRSALSDRWWTRSPNWGRRDRIIRRRIVANMIAAHLTGGH